MVKDETKDVVRGQIMKDLQYPKVAPDRWSLSEVYIPKAGGKQKWAACYKQEGAIYLCYVI